MMRIYRCESIGFAAAVCIVLGFAAPLPSQPESEQQTSAVGERYRQRHLSANQKSIEAFFNRQLPPGWKFSADEKALTLRRLAPVYLLAVAREDYLTQSKPVLLARSKKEGTSRECRINFRVERHDDAAIVRQRLRLYQNIRAGIDEAGTRLNIKRECADYSLEECAKVKGPKGEAAAEFLKTRQILTQKLEPAPVYRIGTLYLYPLKNQCVTAALDWYFVNADYPESISIFPVEAREEIQIILRDLEQLRL